MILFILFLLSIFSVIPFTSSADPLTTVTVDVIQDVTTVDVSPGSVGYAVVQGNVTVDDYNTATPLIVNLNAQATVGSAIIDKTQMVFQGSKKSDTFQVNVQVPIGASASEDNSCTVSGTWQQGGRSGTVEPDTFKIIILPYYLPQISCDSPEKEITQGNSVIFNLLINNSGNTDDIFHVDIRNRAQLKENSITINEIDDIPIQEDGFEEIELKVRTSEETSVRENEIHIVVTSTVDEEPEEIEYELTVQINERTIGEKILSSPIIPIIIVVVIIAVIVVFIKKR